MGVTLVAVWVLHLLNESSSIRAEWEHLWECTLLNSHQVPRLFTFMPLLVDVLCLLRTNTLYWTLVTGLGVVLDNHLVLSLLMQWCLCSGWFNNVCVLGFVVVNGHVFFPVEAEVQVQQVELQVVNKKLQLSKVEESHMMLQQAYSALHKWDWPFNSVILKKSFSQVVVPYCLE